MNVSRVVVVVVAWLNVSHRPSCRMQESLLWRKSTAQKSTSAQLVTVE